MRKLLKPLVVLLAFFVFFHFTLSFAEEVNQNAAKERREELQKKLDNLDSQIETLDSVIQQKRTESASLERDIAIFDAKIKKAKLEIQRLDGEIAKTKTGIVQRTEKIKNLSDESEKKKDSLAELIRKNNEMDSTGLAEIVLGYQKMSDFFVAEDTLEPIHRLIQDTLDEIRTTKKQTEKEKDDLTEKQAEQVQLKMAQEMERKKLAASEAEKKNLLKITKGVEKGYQAVMALKQKDAATIRSQLFLLTGSPDIPFEKALDLANRANVKTGIRPAFLLAIITQETNLGKNIGQCLLTNNPQKGDGVGKNTGKLFKGIMKPTRDVDPFMQITAKLGLDPKLMPISCPQSGGYGGGMGPAQFIPSTWAGFESRIARATGHNPPNPWKPEDAFMASAIYLSDLGADKRTSQAEWEAAMRYFSGNKWKTKPWLNFYGDDVMEFAADYQEQIDIINKMASR